MVYHSIKDSYWFKFSDAKGREHIITDAKVEARRRVDSDFPYGVYRSSQELTRHAEQIYQEWLAGIDVPSYMPDEKAQWNYENGERKRLYTSAYIATYQEQLAVKDEKARPKPAPQPQPQPVQQQAPQPKPVQQPQHHRPATPSNVAMLHGAKITFKDIDRKRDEDLYVFELVDPGHIDEPQLVYLHVGDSVPQQATASGQVMAGSYFPMPAESTGSTASSKAAHVYLKRKRRY